MALRVGVEGAFTLSMKRRHLLLGTYHGYKGRGPPPDLPYNALIFKRFLLTAYNSRKIQGVFFLDITA